MAIKTFITSGKGGVGKSTIAALLGVALSEMGKETLIVELDCGLRSIDVMLGLQDKAIFDLSDILTYKCDVDKATLTCEYAPKLKLISASLDCFVSYNQDDLKILFDKINDRYDYILIDSPAGLGKWFRESLKFVDNALVVVTPDPICVRDACKVSQILYDNGVENQDLIINKVKSKFTKLEILPDLDCVIDMVGVKLISVIPDDINIMKFTFKGLRLPIDSIASKIFSNLCNRMLGKNIPLLIK